MPTASPRCRVQVRSPVFFGVLSGALTKFEATRGGGDLASLKALLSLPAFNGEYIVGEGIDARHGDKRVCLVRLCVASAGCR